MINTIFSIQTINADSWCLFKAIEHAFIRTMGKNLPPSVLDRNRLKDLCDLLRENCETPGATLGINQMLPQNMANRVSIDIDLAQELKSLDVFKSWRPKDSFQKKTHALISEIENCITQRETVDRRETPEYKILSALMERILQASQALIHA